MATFQVNGRTVGYEVVGTGAPVLAFHGTTQSRSSWDQVIDACGTTYTWVKIEFPGSGESSMPTGPIELDHIVDDALALMRDLGHDKFAVVGYSLGAVCALHAAARHPSHVSSVVSLCGWATTDARMRKTFALWRRLISVSPELFMHYALVDGYTAGAIAMIEPMFDAAISMAAATIAPGSDAHLELDERIDIAHELPRISCPTLVIGGIEDRWVDISHSRHIANTVQGATLVELPAGHLVIGELSGDVARAISAHID